ncbi:UNVERIFIED_CONTAM: hypothetical protein FKN15_057617 [Acipenser sinensis]
MKHGQISTKELAEFVRERAAVEESYSKSMSKLSKMASSSSQLGVLTDTGLDDVCHVMLRYIHTVM